jgi:aryl-alcohol dehydrogenase-like predicted oxidoreductase
MQTRRVGSLEVSVIGLGCNNFGWRIDAEASAKVIDAAIESGITFFDTADRYGNGQSEDFLGRALGSRREQVILATKFGMEMEQGQQGASPQYLRKAIEASLRRLKTDRIDLYQLHQPDPKTARLINWYAPGKCARSVARIFPFRKSGKQQMLPREVRILLVCKTSSVSFIATRKMTASWSNAKHVGWHFFPISR